MKKLFFTTVLSVGWYAAVAQTPANDPHWLLTKHWNFKTMTMLQLQADWITDPCVHSLDHDSVWEPQYYKPGNVTLSSTGLKLTVKHESATGKILCYKDSDFVLTDGHINYRTCNFTSGMVATKNAYYKKYGYIEASVKAPYGNTYFPAFWTFRGDDEVGGNANEIDIFEFVPHDDDADEVRTNVHLDYDTDPDRNATLRPFNYSVFNKYAIEWTPSKVTWYINDLVVRTLPITSLDTKIKVILNFALMYGLPSYAGTYPASMEVEYVKFYDYKADCNTIYNCNYNFATYNNMVKQSIQIGVGTGCVNALTVGQNIIMRAKNGILINGDFSVPIGAELYLDGGNCN